MLGHCPRCGKLKKLLNHHEKYEEIHGEEKVVLMCYKCHFNLHKKLREEGKCNISPNELQKISRNSKTAKAWGTKFMKSYTYMDGKLSEDAD